MSDRSLTLRDVSRVLRASELLLTEEAPEDLVVRGIHHDSRRVGPGDLFLAWMGTDDDGHRYLDDARARGAAAFVLERVSGDPGLPWLQVRDGRFAAAVVADAFYGTPWKALLLVGVTGTNGKTTTALLARHLLGEIEPAAALGTLGVVGPDGEVRPDTEGLTSPGPVEFSSRLRELADEGIRSVSVEVSSHALEQKRMDGARFQVAVFTNFSQDHLDYHDSEERYFAAKARLVELVGPGGTVVLNGHDPAWDRLPSSGADRIVFGIRDGEGPGAGEGSGATVDRLWASELDLGPDGSTFRLEWAGGEEEVSFPLLGRFNVENALGAAGAALASGRSLAEVARGLGSSPQLPGRLELVVRREFAVVIDFAHSPEALRGVLETLRPLFPGRLIVVFGAGGDRDRTKRAPMGRVVGEGADLPVVTSDNPRTEDPDRIVDDIVEGLEGREHVRIPDRREAIAYALEEARPGDVVLLAGKGHERYQVVGREEWPFDERVVVREFLEAGEDV